MSINNEHVNSQNKRFHWSWLSVVLSLVICVLVIVFVFIFGREKFLSNSNDRDSEPTLPDQKRYTKLADNLYRENTLAFVNTSREDREEEQLITRYSNMVANYLLDRQPDFTFAIYILDLYKTMDGRPRLNFIMHQIINGLQVESSYANVTIDLQTNAVETELDIFEDLIYPQELVPKLDVDDVRIIAEAQARQHAQQMQETNPQIRDIELIYNQEGRLLYLVDFGGCINIVIDATTGDIVRENWQDCAIPDL